VSFHRCVALVSVLGYALALAGCAGAVSRPPLHTAPAPVPSHLEWVGGPVDFRKLTAIVIARRSAWMHERQIGSQVGSQIGSAFVIVRREGRRVEGFVVTNEHVVGDAQDITVRFADGRAYPHCQVLSVDLRHDLAVLGLPDGSPPFEYGLIPASRPPAELQTVVASGFPLIGREPSFQVTEGNVSNASAHAPWSGELFIQHTAPMAEGSSGGPLTSARGELLGVNTGGLRDREGAYFAVPVDAVERAVRRAFEVRAGFDN